MKRFLLASLLLGFVFGVKAQTTVFSDNFNTSTGATYTIAAGAIGTSSIWAFSRSGADWGSRIDGNILDMTNDGSAAANVAGWGFAYTPTPGFLGPYNTVLSSNIGVVTWTFNMRQIRSDPAGFSSGSYGVAFVLGSSSNSPNASGNGYAVVLGNTTATDPVRLAKFTGGISSLGTTAPPSANDIIVSNTAGLTDFGSEYLSVKVTYTPSTNTWELFLRNDGASFTDPASGSLTSQGTAVDATYTGSSLTSLGAYWQGSTAANQTSFFDNVTVTVTSSNTITTDLILTPPFSLANCSATAAATVNFTASGTFNAGNVYTAYLSDDIGSFAAATNIGTLTSTSSGALSISATIPAGTVSGTLYQIRVVSSNPSVTGSASTAFTITQAGNCASSHTDYYRSIQSGDWNDVNTWESSSDNFATVISPATLAPTFNANTITIRNGHNVTIAAAESADQLTIQSGGTLTHSNGSAFVLNDGTGVDMSISNGGIYAINGTQPSGSGSIEVNNGGLVRVESNPSPTESDDFAYGNANVTFRTGSIYDWATSAYTPQWSGRVYFTSSESPRFRFSQTPNFSLGGGTLTIIYGYLEANANLVLQGAGTKTFTNGIIGTAKVDASGSTGQLIIDGVTSQLAGDSLKLPPAGLSISGSTCTMTSSKIIVGDVIFSGATTITLGNNDLTVSSAISGYGPTAYVRTNGTGYLKMNGVGGTRVFPVGVTGLNALYVNNGGLADYSVRVENGINPAIAFPTYGINRTWNVFASAATSGVELTFWYSTADANPGALPQPQNMEILKHSGVAWSITPGNGSIAPTGSNPWLVTTPVAGYFTIGTTAEPYALGISGGWVLPIDCVISLKAQKRNSSGNISWTVNSCAEVTSFELQRSVNGGAYQTIHTIRPSANETDFAFTDAQLAKGRNLYRIKVNRLSGSLKYSNTVALIHDSNDILITSVSPNPASSIATLTISTAKQQLVNFVIYNNSGTVVRSWSKTVTEGNNNIDIYVAGLPAGTYHIMAVAGGNKTVSSFIKQ